MKKTLDRYCEVLTFDPKIQNHASLSEDLRSADLILGCSGTTALNYSKYTELKAGAVLASFSSSDREFQAYKFRRKFPRSSDFLQTVTDNNITLLQSGFPLNFWGSRNNIPIEKIQITLSLLQSAVYQALNFDNQGSGIIPIDEESERLIMEEFLKIVVKKSKLHPILTDARTARLKNAKSYSARNYKAVSP